MNIYCNSSPIGFCDSPYVKNSKDQQLLQRIEYLVSLLETGSLDDIAFLQEKALISLSDLREDFFIDSAYLQRNSSAKEEIFSILIRCTKVTYYDSTLVEDVNNLKERITNTIR